MGCPPSVSTSARALAVLENAHGRANGPADFGASGGRGVLLPVAGWRARRRRGHFPANPARSRPRGCGPARAAQPLASLKRILGPDGAIEFLRTLLKLGLVGGALWWALGGPEAALALLHLPAGALLQRGGQAALGLVAAALAAFAAIAVLDWLWVRWRHLRRLRMSRQDMRRKPRRRGRPPVRGRLRQLARRAPAAA